MDHSQNQLDRLRPAMGDHGTPASIDPSRAQLGRLSASKSLAGEPASIAPSQSQLEQLMAEQAGGASPAAQAVNRPQPALKTLSTSVPAPAKAWTPGTEDYLAANDARMWKLYELGHAKEAEQDFIRGAAQRAAIRKQAVQDGLADFKMTRNPEKLFRAYDQLSDGQRVKSYKPVQAPGQPLTWAVTRVNERTGEETIDQVGEREIVEAAMFMADPEKSIGMEAKLHEVERRAFFDGLKQQAITDRSIRVQGLRNEGSANVAQTRADATMGAARVRARAPSRASTSPASKPMPAAALKLEQEERDALGVASGLDQQLDRFQGLVKSGQLQLGPVENVISQGRNAIGASSENSRNYASFKATLEKLRNDSLRLNKGVQTEGDSVRAWNELVANINDPKVVEQRLQEIRAINARAMTARQQNVREIRANYGQEAPDLSPYTQGAGQGARQISTPEEYHALPAGTQYLDPNGNLRTKR